ncbi:CBS domain-containing protein [Actinocrinis puniceicyclus]|uniref:CBS domain-containing protein n=1 Tax=Actinocrinis puniceicyclus TaxID=977794 RepID=A0A8J7WVJ6_9ACTN|nr:CBS domain-containing protein [Actinocrinis puniceicyclus]MBS2966929.1 CBS domain-containing protein [Actinocrinis puniceicyclus]
MEMQRDVRDVMSCSLITVAPDASAARVVQLLKNYQIGAVPVVAAGARVLGVITEGDLIDLPQLAGKTAAQVMTAPAICVGEGAPVHEALRLIAEHGVGRLPVVDGRGRVVGIVSRRDLLSELLPGDGELRRKIIDRVIDLGGEVFSVRVDDGAVSLCGRVGDVGEIALIERALRLIDGVVSVDATFTVHTGEHRELVRG